MGQERLTKSEPRNYADHVIRAVVALHNHVVDSGNCSNLAEFQRVAEEVAGYLTISAAMMRSAYGFSWADVGRGLGISRSAAQKRFGVVSGWVAEALADDGEDHD